MMRSTNREVGRSLGRAAAIIFSFVLVMVYAGGLITLLMVDLLIPRRLQNLFAKSPRGALPGNRKLPCKGDYTQSGYSA